MSLANIDRRLASLEGSTERNEDLVKVSFQWFFGDTPTTEKIDRLVPRSWLQDLKNCLRKNEEHDP